MKPLVLLAIITLGTIIWYSSFWPTPIDINLVGETNGTVLLSLTPATLTIEPNTESMLTLGINAGEGRVTGAQIEILYDSSKIGTPIITLGDFLANTLSSVKTDNNKITFTLGAAPDSGGKIGSGTLATIKIKPPIIGSSTLKFGEMNVITIIGSQTNMLKSATDVTITVATALASSSPSLSPSPSPSTSSPSPLVTLRHDSSTCSSLNFSWDRSDGAKGYIIDLADNEQFSNKLSSENLPSTKTSYTFTNLKPNTKYYARLSLTQIHDFPRYNTLKSIMTSTSCLASSTTPTPSAKPTVKPTTKPTIKPSPSIVSSPLSTPDLIPQDPDPVSLSVIPNTQPNFFQKISLGWQAIFAKLVELFQ